MMRGAAGALLMALAGFACSSGERPDRRVPAPAAAGTPAADSRFAQVRGSAPAGALVTLEPAASAAPMPAGDALMDQYSKQFVPTLLFVRVGQRVVFRNSEDQLHDVTVVRSRTGTTVFNVSQEPFQSHEFTFDRAGEFDVNCDVHPGMRATIVAATTPHAVFADAAGRFSLSNVVPGSYKLQIASGGQVRERAVEIAGGTVDVGQ